MFRAYTYDIRGESASSALTIRMATRDEIWLSIFCVLSDHWLEVQIDRDHVREILEGARDQGNRIARYSRTPSFSSGYPVGKAEVLYKSDI